MSLEFGGAIRGFNRKSAGASGFVLWIGRIGSTLADLVDAVDVMASPDGAACLAQLQSDAAHLQQLLMGTSLDAGQGHP